MDNLQNFIQHVLALLDTVDVTEISHSSLEKFLALLKAGDIAQISTTAATSFALIAAAEIGDKSQLVCMTLAARHKAMPVLLGAIAAFALLNTLAVVFGVHSLRMQEDGDDEDVKEKSGHGIFFTTFLLITVAEFGDKTQLAVVALSSTAVPIAVWLGSTVALTSTSALGIWAGRTILQKVPLVLLHKISGTIFLILSALAGYRAYTSFTALP